MRDETDHDPFGTSALQLVLGRSRGGEIVHISRVARGRACHCSCPACGEPLIARQGELLSWHFAHQGGHSCAEAQGKAFAARLSDLLGAGRRFRLPEAKIYWGGSQVDRISGQDTRFKAVAVTPFGLQGRTEHGELVDLLIKPAARSSGLAADVRDPAATYRLELDLRPFGCEMGDEDELDLYLLDQSPRRWSTHAGVERRREDMIRARLGSWRHAYDRPEGRRSRPSHDACITRLHALHLEPFITTPSIAGEAFLAAPAQSWRAAIFHDLVVMPFLTGSHQVLLRDAGFGAEKIDRVIMRHDLDCLFDPAFSLSEDDRMEACRLLPGHRAPRDIVEDYLLQLVHRRALRCSSKAFLEAAHLPRSSLAPGLSHFSHLAWVADERIATHVVRMRRAEAMLSSH